MIKKIFLSTIITLCAAGIVLAGGGSRNGTGGASELLIPVGARGIAMGGANLANSVGLEALYWNPANISRVGDYNTGVLVSHMNHIADIGVDYGAVSINVEGFGAVAFSIKSLSVGDIEITTADNPDGTGATFEPQFVTVGLTYSRLLSDRISVGLTGNFISEKLGLVDATGIAFNVGVTYSSFANIEGLNIAVVMKNIGPQMKFDGSGLLLQAGSGQLNRPDQLYKVEAQSFELPSTLELGLSYQYTFNEENALQLAGQFSNNNFWGDEYKIGGEYEYNDLLFVRTGFSYAPELDADANLFGINAGLGLKYDLGGANILIDYAYQAVKFDALGDRHVFSVGFGF